MVARAFVECKSRTIAAKFNACSVQGSGFKVQGSGFRVQGSRFRVQVQGSGFRVQRRETMINTDRRTRALDSITTDRHMLTPGKTCAMRDLD